MSEHHVGTLGDPETIRAVELVWHEADLLDRKDYQTWKDLYDPDGLYVIPIDREGDDFADRLNMVFDDATMRDHRVARMTEGHALAAVDAARTVRTVSRFARVSASPDEVTIRAAQMLVAYKRGRHDVWASENTYTIALSPDGDRIVQKVVRLIDSEDAVPAAGFLL